MKKNRSSKENSTDRSVSSTYSEIGLYEMLALAQPNTSNEYNIFMDYISSSPSAFTKSDE